MSQRKLIFMILLTGVIVATSWLIALFKPVGDEDAWSRELSNVTLDDLAEFPSAATGIAFFQDRLKENSKDAVGFTILGNLYMRQARETGDASVYTRAEDAFLRSLELIPGYSAAQASLASAYYAQHRFGEALDLSKKAYENDPTSVQAFATIGDAYLELGMYGEAENVYNELRQTSPTPAVLARVSHLAYLKGNVDEATLLLRNATQEELRSGQSKESVAWYLVRSGDLLLKAGRIDEAENHIEAALKLWDGYHLALASMGRIRASQGRYDDAIELYEQSVDIVPLPMNLAALGDLYALKGDNRKARMQFDTIELIAELEALNKVIYNRELALFYADHDLKPEEAVELARNELEIRKDVYGYDALAWALFKDGQYEEASEVMAKALRLGTQDASMFYHAGMIQMKLGDEDLALGYLTDALELKSGLSPVHSAHAGRAVEQIYNKLALSTSGGE